MKIKISIFSILLFAIFLAACEDNQETQSSLLSNESQIDSILSQMTLEEKVNMLHGKYTFTSAGVERLGIADIQYADGPFGIREELQPDGWAPLGWTNDSATFFPTGSALAATWSPDLAYAYGKAMAIEARLRGKDMILGPAINIQRIPTGGRTYEYLSEDPFLSARLSLGYTKGAQENGVAVCLKHYALNNQENNRGNVNVIVGERTMREIYLLPFEAAVREGDAFGVMAAYNKVNGWWCSENDMLLNKILRDEWGFAGMVISDWYGTHSTVDAIKNGLNVEMPGKQFLGQALLDSVNAGIISEELIDQRVREILRVRLAIEPVPEELANKEVTSQPEQQKTAYQVAANSVVLLKNEGILPLDLNQKPKILVIGDNATRKMAQGGVGAGVKALYEITPLEGLKNRIGDKAEIMYIQGYAPREIDWRRFGRMTKEERENESRDYENSLKKMNEEALQAAASADIILFIGGNNRSVESEARDRRDIMLPFGQDELISRLADVNPNIISVLVCGAPVDLNTIDPLSKALVYSWFNGSEGGNALADILLGNISPGGRLPFTLPLRLEDSPAYALGNYPQGGGGRDIFVGGVEGSGGQIPIDSIHNDPNTAYYSEESLVGYRWFATKNVDVMYPFGHGLTYTTFEYSNISSNKSAYQENDVIRFSFELKNIGDVPAAEVVQCYVHRINSGIDWPDSELKAFSKVYLQPGTQKKVVLEIPVSKLQYWNEINHDWSYDPCEIELRIGASSKDIRLTTKVTLR